MLILGIDPGSKFLGWSILEIKNGKSKIIEASHIEPSKKDSIDELGYYKIFSDLLKILKKYSPDHCYIERYMPYKGKARGAYVVPAVIAIVRLCWYSWSKTKAKLVPASTWKTLVLKEAYADKAKIKRHALKLKLTTDKNLQQDTYDAILIAYYGGKIENSK